MATNRVLIRITFIEHRLLKKQTMDKIIQLLEKLNSNIEKLLVEQSEELPTYTRKQTMNILRVSTGTITNYERTYGNKFKVSKNAYSKRFVDGLKKAKNITKN